MFFNDYTNVCNYNEIVKFLFHVKKKYDNSQFLIYQYCFIFKGNTPSVGGKKMPIKGCSLIGM
jgi:hypothetical protein